MMSTADTDWFVHDRFGLFIHWGLYAMPARHEWVKSREQIPTEDYDRKYFRHFEPDLYDPGRWAEAAQRAGMKYFVVTTKHHEGFCLWDSAHTDYKAPNTPAGRDLLRPMVDAFRNRGLRTGFYHSLIDWHHPQYVIDRNNHPLRNAENLEELNRDRDQQAYADVLHAQVRELLTDFGDVDVLWFDFSFAGGMEHPHDFANGKNQEAWRSRELLEMIRELQPGIILNDRLDLPDSWDVKTPEQFQPRKAYTVDGKPVVWEACQTLSGSWGYHRDENSFRSSRQLILTLLDCVSKNGNLLLNVGPTARGEFDYRALERLEAIGKWMHHHSRAIYGCGPAPTEFTRPENSILTCNPQRNSIFIALTAWPYKHLHLDGPAWRDHAEYAQFLHDGSEVRFQGVAKWQEHAALNSGFDASSTLTLELPQTEPLAEIPVIEVFLKS